MAEKKVEKPNDPVEPVPPTTPDTQESVLPEGTLATPDSLIKGRRPLA